MKCMKVIERDPVGQVHKGCPNDAEEEVLMQVNNLPYLLELCLFHVAEFDREAAAARARRNEANKKQRELRQQRASSPSRV